MFKGIDYIIDMIVKVKAAALTHQRHSIYFVWNIVCLTINPETIKLVLGKQVFGIWIAHWKFRFIISVYNIIDREMYLRCSRNQSC